MKLASVASHRSPPVASTRSSIGEGFGTKDTSYTYHLPNGISNHFGQTASPSLVQRSGLKKQSMLGQKQSKKSINSPRLKPASSLKLVAATDLSTTSVDSISGTMSTPDISNFMQAATLKDTNSHPVFQRRGSLDLDSSALPLRLRPLNSSSLTSTTSATSTSENGTLTEKAVMDLYVLKQSTDFYHQLYATWRDSNIVSACLIASTIFTNSCSKYSSLK